MLQVIALLVSTIFINSHTYVGPVEISQRTFYVFELAQDADITSTAYFHFDDIGTNVIDFNNCGFGPGGHCASLFAAQRGDVINTAAFDSVTWLLDITDSPLIFNVPYNVDETFYLGVKIDDTSYGWVMIDHTDGTFYELASVMTYDGESLVVGGLDGDFDLNGVVDGRDFLTWQRRPLLGPLTMWQDAYVQAALLSSPEPRSGVLLLGGLIIVCLFRRWPLVR